MGAKKNREQRLLLLLTKRHDYITSEELAEHLETSQKTIYRLIKKINETHGEGLIQSEKGRGYKLNYEKYISQANIQPSQRSQYSPQERRNRVMEELLLSSPNAKNVYDLFEDYYVGESVIFSDEQVIAEHLQRYELKLERKQRTLAILGKEANLRRAIADLIQVHNIIEIDDLKNHSELNFNNYDVLFILDQLKLIEKQLQLTIPYPYNVNIFSHLYILISRLRKVHRLPNEETVEEMIERIQRNEVIEHVGVNSNKVVLSHRDAEIKKIIQQADMVSADGYSVVRACRWLKKKDIDRVTGIDTMMALLKEAEELELTVYFLGTKEAILNKLLEVLKQQYPKLKIAGAQHGYFKDEQEVVKEIADCQPQMLFIGMTSPYKEAFVNKYKKELNANLIMGVGGSFDVLAGEISRAPAWMQRNGLEWLHRFMKEPQRLYKRYIFENVYFIYLLVQEKFK